MEFIANLDVYQICMIAFIFMFLNGVISAPPSEITIVSIAFASIQIDFLSFIISLCFCLIGNSAGALTLYFIGNYWGDIILKALNKISPNYLNNIIDILVVLSEKMRSGKIHWIFYSRFLPVIRSIISFPAGMAQIDVKNFFLLTFFGCAIWIFSWGFIGIVFHEIYLAYGAIYSAISILLIVIFYLYLKSRLKSY